MATFSEAVTRVGQSIGLRCAATGVPSPRIYWSLDDRSLPSAPEKYACDMEPYLTIFFEEMLLKLK